MNSFNNNTLLSANEFIKNYDLLKKMGIWDHLEKFNKEINNLNELLNEALKIFKINSNADLIEYVSKILLNKFVPSYLAFIIQDELFIDRANIICYKNMKLVDSFFDIESIIPYRNFFSLSPAIITYDAFCNMMNNKRLTDVFLPLDPKIIVPMMGHEGMYGFIIIGKKVLGYRFTDEDIDYISKILIFASVTLQNNLHHKGAIIDIKTKLYKHSYFLNKLDEEISRTKRYGSGFSLLMIDIDHFKKINDKFGHLFGDKVLEFIAKLLKSIIRNEDVISRFGGEEFMVLLVGADKEKAFNTAERIRNKIMDSQIEYLEKKISITVSIGVLSATVKNLNKCEELIKKVDIALYKAKRSGRNKSVIFKD